MLERVVLDTNVLVSALLNADSAQAKVLNLVLSGEIIIIYDSRTYSEYRSVLERPRFSFPIEYVETLLSFVQREGELVTPLPMEVQLPDPTDLPFIEVGATANAPVVMSNHRHLSVNGVRILTPGEMVMRWREGHRLRMSD